MEVFTWWARLVANSNLKSEQVQNLVRHRHRRQLQLTSLGGFDQLPTDQFDEAAQQDSSALS